METVIRTIEQVVFKTQDCSYACSLIENNFMDTPFSVSERYGPAVRDVDTRTYHELANAQAAYAEAKARVTQRILQNL